ncbi:MAG TPA: anthranilate synthase component I [Pirellulaceae bacterium]|nr:anthranilate synthase component I [Pirellulaceae bacterium]
MITPSDYDRFRELAADYRLVPVCRTLVADSLTPVSAFRRLDRGGAAGLFESVIGGEKVGRYSFVAFEPYRTIRADRNRVTITDAAGERSFEAPDPLDELRRLVAAESMAHPADLPPFAGGAIGFAGYDVVRYVEHLPNAPTDDRGLPDLYFGFFDRMVVFDHVAKKLIVVALARIEPGSDPHAAFDEACRRLDEIVDRLRQPTDRLDIVELEAGEPLELPVTSNVTPERFRQTVRDCVEYIRAGDIFQVVVSQRLQTPIDCDPFEIYRTLRAVNPSPFMFYLRTPAVTLVGSSPEIMCRVVDRRVTVRPLAGTRRRGATEAEDLRLEQELLADPKERAEHVMLVDLGRNDVGRVAEFGSVELPDVMVVERYSHVMHISSTVNGRLRDDRDAFDALAASLPAGTVSGAPKVRAMEIIDEFETTRRGPYAGAVGYVDFAGNMDTCIALRTIVVSGSTAYVQAGAGIVADSDPESEYQETLNKARGMLRAIELAERRHRARGVGSTVVTERGSSGDKK